MKKLTKEKRIKQEKAELRQRLLDLAAGAYGGYQSLDWLGEEFGGMATEVGLEVFGRWIGAIRVTFCGGDRADYRVSDTSLGKFDSVNGAVEWLYECHVRAK
jgi:hypothetical protein